MSVSVYPFILYVDSRWKEIGNVNLDLSSHVPATAGKCKMVLISVDTSGNLVQTAGSEVDLTALAPLTDTPQPPAGTKVVLGAVRCYQGQTATQMGRQNKDIMDLRWIMPYHTHPSGETGAGDVIGPESSTDNALARWDGTGGDTLQDSLAIVDDSGTVNIPSGQTYNIDGSPHSHAGGSGFYGDQLLRAVAPVGGQASFNLDPLPSGYDYIEILIAGFTASGNNDDKLKMQYNGDAVDGNYATYYHYAGTTGSNGSTTGWVSWFSGTTVSMAKITVPNPSGTVFVKIARSIGSVYTGQSWETDVYYKWNNTAAINRITLKSGSGSNFVEGTLCVITGWKNH